MRAQKSQRCVIRTTAATMAAAVLASLCIWGCTAYMEEPEQEETDVGRNRASLAPQQRWSDNEGRTWYLVKKVEFVDAEPVPPSGKEADPDIYSMSEQALAEHFRPRALLGEYEYTLSDEDARKTALMLRETAQQEMDGAEYGSAGEMPTGVDVDVASTPDEREYHDVIGSDNRVLINSLARTYPYSNTGRQRNWCSVFKMVNHYTAVTSAHCVHDGSSWLTRRSLVFGDPEAPLPDVPAWCYGIIVPGCWDGDTVSCDYAVMYLRGRNGAWCPNNTHWVGYLGWNSVSGCVTGIKAYLSGYPLPPPFGWSYPALVYHYRSDGWTSCGTYPARVWYYNDATGGQSGAPLVSYWSDGSWRVRAIHNGFHEGVFEDTNQGRRMTSSLYNWLASYAGY